MSKAVSLPSSIDSKTGLALSSSLLIQPLLQSLQSRFRSNFGFDDGQIICSRLPNSAYVRATSEGGNRFISHSGQTSSFVEALSLQKIHLRNYFYSDLRIESSHLSVRVSGAALAPRPSEAAGYALI